MVERVRAISSFIFVLIGIAPRLLAASSSIRKRMTQQPASCSHFPCRNNHACQMHRRCSIRDSRPPTGPSLHNHELYNFPIESRSRERAPRVRCRRVRVLLCWKGALSLCLSLALSLSLSVCLSAYNAGSGAAVDVNGGGRARWRVRVRRRRRRRRRRRHMTVQKRVSVRRRNIQLAREQPQRSSAS